MSRLKQREIWKVYSNNTNYEISNMGRIRRATDGKPAKGNWINPRARKYYILSQFLGERYSTKLLTTTEGKKLSCSIHRAVLETFSGPCPEGKECNHKDGNKTNNKLDNLEWVTPSENQKHAYKTGLQPAIDERKTTKGELNRHAKLKEGEVWLIKKILQSSFFKRKGIKQYQIAQMFKVSFITITDIKVGNSWKHIII